MRRPEPTRKNLLIGGGVLAGVLLLVATLLSITRTEPTLADASSRPTTTTTTTTTASTATAPATSNTEAPTTAAAPTTTTAPGPAGLSPLPARTSEVATVRDGVDELTLYEGPTGSSSGDLSARGDYGQRQVFLVVGREGDRLHVLLPIRPNGSKAWIEAADVDVATHDDQIQVSISGFKMMVQKGTEVVVDTAIGVGTQDTPTVGGEFYTWVLIDPTNNGYGSYAYGLSGFSTLEQFAGGDGRMGVHGTADRSSIGRNVSRGCVRVPDGVVVDMVEDIGLPLGVPVIVTA
ncbi:hypothetical protein BH24ACT4_BH24ACT4_00210 [soil metagenome]